MFQSTSNGIFNPCIFGTPEFLTNLLICIMFWTLQTAGTASRSASSQACLLFGQMSSPSGCLSFFPIFYQTGLFFHCDSSKPLVMPTGLGAPAFVVIQAVHHSLSPDAKLMPGSFLCPLFFISILVFVFEFFFHYGKSSKHQGLIYFV